MCERLIGWLTAAALLLLAHGKANVAVVNTGAVAGTHHGAALVALHAGIVADLLLLLLLLAALLLAALLLAALLLAALTALALLLRGILGRLPLFAVAGSHGRCSHPQGAGQKRTKYSSYGPQFSQTHIRPPPQIVFSDI
ncbi:hypothetical protein [Solidesulfovibrio aerotolerans]|uniref:hypothetical protein n=1 Tax=Solidesulfovibrio aerotolerans TaxID=295255 RepID=UPI001BA6209D|nr:hypothetical protein [Solidesulfovibrio aerotolerans]